MRPPELTSKERAAFLKLWAAGVATADISRALPRHAARNDNGWRYVAVRAGQPFYRDGEGPKDKSQVDEAVLRALLKKPRVL